MIELSFSPVTVPPGPRIGIDVEVAGHVLRLNGQELDLSFLQEGDTLPVDAISGPGAECLGTETIHLTGGVLHVQVRLPISFWATDWARFADLSPMLITSDGPVILPELEYPHEPLPLPPGHPDAVPVPPDEQAPAEEQAELNGN